MARNTQYRTRPPTAHARSSTFLKGVFMNWYTEDASSRRPHNEPLERPATRIRSLATAQGQRYTAATVTWEAVPGRTASVR
jgi:hypothetical protein